MLCLLLLGCAASEPSAPPSAKTMQEHEKSFDPAAYRTPKEEKPAPAAEETPKSNVTAEVWVERVERGMGYRVQLFSTTTLDEAQESLARMSSILDSIGIPEGRLDLVFDAPYYKLRYGDFRNRGDADRIRSVMHEAGIREAWIVRDAVRWLVREKEQR